MIRPVERRQTQTTQEPKKPPTASTLNPKNPSGDKLKDAFELSSSAKKTAPPSKPSLLKPIVEKKSPVSLTEEQTRALARIQTFGRGTLARSKMAHHITVLPHELEGAIKTALEDVGPEPSWFDNVFGKSEKRARKLSIILSREILESFKESPQNYKIREESPRNDKIREIREKRLYHQSGTYTYKTPDGKKKELKVPMDIWISRQGSKVDIELISPNMLADGGSREVYPSHRITVSLKTPEHKPESQKTVISRFKPENKVFIEEGIQLVSKNFTTQEIEELHLSGILTKMNRISPILTSFKGENTSGLHEAQEKRYQGDLLDLTTKWKLAEEWEHTTEKKREKQKILSDVGRAAKAFHNKGLVHRDIKQRNILIDEMGNGYLSDFDLTCSIGYHDKVGGTKKYVDALAWKGIVTPFTDIYALAVMAEELGIDSAKAQAVRAANKRPVPEKLKEKLKSDNPQVKQQALKDLNQEFPEFQIFLDSLIQVPAK